MIHDVGVVLADGVVDPRVVEVDGEFGVVEEFAKAVQPCVPCAWDGASIDED